MTLLSREAQQLGGDVLRGFGLQAIRVKNEEPAKVLSIALTRSDGVMLTLRARWREKTSDWTVDCSLSMEDAR